MKRHVKRRYVPHDFPKSIQWWYDWPYPKKELKLQATKCVVQINSEQLTIQTKVPYVLQQASNIYSTNSVKRLVVSKECKKGLVTMEHMATTNVEAKESTKENLDIDQKPT